MRIASTGPAVWVQITQALVARELVDGFGLPERRAASLLGLAPSAVSQYLNGKRLRGPMSRVEARADVRRLARRLAQQLISAPDVGTPSGRAVLDGAGELVELVAGRAGAPSAGPGPATAPRPGRALRASLRARIRGEQTAVADCMHLAQKSRDELTRAIFRQIASDSLRHADIVASLATYLDRGVDRTFASGITRADIDRLVAREKAAEATTDPEFGRRLGGVMGLLWESMEADERKHEALLDRLRTVELLAPGRPRVARRRLPRSPA